jgi:hypothetical protein
MALGDGPYSQYIMGQVEARTNQIIQTAEAKEDQYQAALDALAAINSLNIELSDVSLETLEKGFEVAFPDAPSSPTLLGNQDVDLSEQAPDAGDISSINQIDLPEVPTLSNLLEPDEVSVSDPTMKPVKDVLDANFPDVNYDDIKGVDDPSLTAYVDKGDYYSDLLEKLKSTLLGILNAGGAGLGSTIQRYMFELYQDQVSLNNSTTYEQTERMMASTGFSMPSGVRSAMLYQVIVEQGRATEVAAKEISNKEAELAYQQFMTSLNEASKLEATLIDDWHRAALRALEAWKVTTQASIDIFEAQLKKITDYVNVLKVDADIATTQQQAWIAKAQFDIEENKLILAEYETKKDIALGNADIQKTILQAQATKNQQLLDIYKSKVEAILLQLKADMDVIDAEIKRYGLDVTVFQTKMDKQKTQAQINADYDKNQVGLFQAEVQAFSSKNDAQKADGDLQLADKRVLVDQNKASADVEISRDRVNMDNALRSQQLYQDILTSVTNTTSQLLASLYSAVQAGAQMSYQNQYQASESESDSRSEEHVYNY